MKAFRVRDFETPPSLEDVPQPELAAGEVLVRMEACGLNYADLLMARGQYQERPDAPLTLGMELAGTVEAKSPQITSPVVGARVAVLSGTGGLAEYVAAPAARCVGLPVGMKMQTAAAFQVAYGTGHVALDHRARLAHNETLLVLGAAGGVGLAAVEIGKVMGARVIACARGPERVAVAEAAGADHGIDTEATDIRATVNALGGADVVYDPVGGEQFAAALGACRPEARYILVGFASGDVPQIAANHVLVKNVDLLGLYWGGYLTFRPEVLTGSLSRLFAWFEGGRISPHISHCLPLSQAGEALELLRSRKVAGKVVIRSDPSA